MGGQALAGGCEVWLHLSKPSGAQGNSGLCSQRRICAAYSWLPAVTLGAAVWLCCFSKEEIIPSVQQSRGPEREFLGSELILSPETR